MESYVALMNAAREFGVGNALLIAALVVLWRSLIWFGREILVPLRDHLASFLSEVKGDVATLKEGMGRIEARLGTLPPPAPLPTHVVDASPPQLRA